MNDELRILVFSAHAADFCSRSGGTIARHVGLGAAVRVVDVTFGERGESGQLWKDHPEISLEEVKAIRREEARRAAKILGAEIRFLDWDDYPLFIDRRRLLHLVDEIREMRPQIVLTHHRHEPVNIDHGTIAEAVVKACACASTPGHRSTYPPTRSPALFFFEAAIPLTEFEGFNPDVYVEITDVFDQKLQALRELKAQPFLPEWYAELALRRGWQARSLTGDKTIKYAEAFERFFPWVGDRLPL